MRGLLDWASTPEGIGLLSAAFGGLAGARPGQPLNSLGRAGLAGLSGFSSALDAQAARETREQKGQMQTLQMQELQQRMAAAKRTEEEAQRAREEAAAKAQARGSFLGSIDPNAGPALPFSVPQAMLAGLSQQEIQALMPAKAENPFGKVDPRDYTSESVRKFAMTNNFADLVPARKVEFVDGRAVDPFNTAPGTVIPQRAPVSNPFNDLVVPGPDGQLVPNVPVIGAKKGVAAAGATRIDNSQRFENSYSTNQGKEFSELMGGINKTAFAAPAQIRKLERMEALLQGVDGGKLAPTGLDIASAANSLGIKLDPKLGNKEAAQALAREIAGGFRQPGTGPMTDKDFENFLLQVPDLSKTAEGRKQITATMKSALNRDIQIAKMAREYERKNGRLDNAFLDIAAQYIAENPVVGAPQGWKVK